MLAANQIAGFLKQPYLENKTVNKLDFLHVDTNIGKNIGDYFENYL